MGINTKVARIPFFLLYLIIVGLVSYNWIRVILFQKDFNLFFSSQPWDYYLLKFATENFGITKQQYFIFTFPLVLVFLYIIPKILGRFLNLDKKTNIKGDNHIALLVILLLLPGVFNLPRILGSSWQSHLIPGIVLVVLFSIWSAIDEQKVKQ